MSTPGDPVLNNVGSERVVLAGILKYGADALIDIEDILGVDDFFDSRHKKLFHTLKYLVHEKGAKGFDSPTIVATAQMLGHEKLEERGRDEEWINSFQNGVPSMDNARALAAVVYKLSLARQAYYCTLGIQKGLRGVNGQEKSEDILGLLEDPVFDFTGKVMSGKSALTPIAAGYEQAMNALIAVPKDIVGLPTMFQRYDEAIGGGFRGGTVNVIGARPKQGKSFWCLNVAKQMGVQMPVLYLDTELTREHQMMRLASLVSGVELDRIETGSFGAITDEKKAVFEAQKYIENLKIAHCSIAGMSIKSVLSIVRRWLTKHVGFTDAGIAGPCVVIYDYLKLMDSSDIRNNLAEYQLLGFLLSEMHNFTLKYNIPIMATVQLNRDGNEREGGDVISGSDRILWLCSSFAILKRKTPEELNEDPPSNGDRKLVVTDTRFGPGMEPGQYINLKYDLSRARISEGPKFSQALQLGNKKKAPAKP